MPGSAVSVANANIVLNTAVAEVLEQIYDTLKDVPQRQQEETLRILLRQMLIRHKRVLFNGNGYTDEWVEEAKRRGLDNLRNLPEAMPHWITDKSIDLFTKHGIFTREEIFSRYDILLENFAKTIHIESLTMQDMVRKDFTAGIVAYMKDLTQEACQKKTLLPDCACTMEESILKRLDQAAGELLKACETLDSDTKEAEQIDDLLTCAQFYQDTILPDMEELRRIVDGAEYLIPDQYLPYPTYAEILFSLR